MDFMQVYHSVITRAGFITASRGKESEQLSSSTMSLRIAFAYSTQPAPPTRTQLSHSTGVLVVLANLTPPPSVQPRFTSSARGRRSHRPRIS
ncbi:hypothetical protein BDW67DRAFT_159833, partial [Aspergillus spinulosporus]